MRKLLIMGLVLYGVSCSNPEDRATGDPDSTKFNSDGKKILNTTPHNSDVDKPDTSITTDPNRTYGSGDSTKH